MDLVHNNNHNFKVNLSHAGMLYDSYNSELISEYWVGTDDLASILLSDHIELYERMYAGNRLNLEQDRSGGSHWQLAMWQIATSHWDGLEATVDDLKKIDEPNSIFHDIDIYYSIYSGFLNKDKAVLEKALNELELPKYRKVRQQHVTLEKYISLYTTALAKMAWMHGMEVEIDSEYVPKDILPYQPLEEYTIPYWFLRDFYREQGIDWRYDPVYPELQDWENDPENPKNQRGRKGFFASLFGK